MNERGSAGIEGEQPAKSFIKLDITPWAPESWKKGDYLRGKAADYYCRILILEYLLETALLVKTRSRAPGLD